MSDVPKTWQDWAAGSLPKRMSTNTLASQLVGLALIAPLDVQWQALSEAVFAYRQDQPTSPDDALPYIGQEAGLPQYATEPNDAFRRRLDAKWDIWRTAGLEECILGQLEQAGFNDSGFTPFIIYDLPGGGDNGVTDPSAPGYSPEYAGTQIPQYPASTDWWSQFALVVSCTSPLGTGAPLTFDADGNPLTFSRLLSADQLLAIRLIVAKFKPATWVARELVVQYLPTSGSVVWDQLNPDGTYAHSWDDGTITWAASGSLPGGDVVEHMSLQNSWRWRPIF